MTDVSGPFDSSQWAEAEWFRHMPAAMPSGCIGTGAASISVGALPFSSSGLNVTIGAGNANVGGAGFSRSGTPAANPITPNGNATLARRDRIVARRDLGTHNVTVVVIQGTPASSPAAPPYVRDATKFDLPLFSFLVPANNGTSISGVIDERAWVDDGATQVVDKQVGRTGCSVSGANSATGTVVFPVPFATAPAVQLTVEMPPGSGVDMLAVLTSTPTTTGFTWRVRVHTGSTQTVTAFLHWEANAL